MSDKEHELQARRLANAIAYGGGDQPVEKDLNRYDKDAAILKILKVLKNPMMVMSVYNRDEALTLAEEYGITAKDLIEEWTRIAERI